MADNKDDPETIGKLFMEMVYTVLGTSAKELTDYYGQNWEGLVMDIAPLFIDVIYPACDRAHNAAINGLKKKKRG